MENNRGKELQRWDVLFALFLFLSGIATRVPFANYVLYDSDAARFALAMEEFDVRQQRPHAPGYILYVMLGKLLNLLVGDASVSLVWMSIIFGALTVFFLYFLGLRMYGRTNAVVASLLLLTSPLFWFNGEIPLSYAAEGFFSVLLGFICYEIIRGNRRWIIISAIILGLAGGVRQNAIPFLLPLWLFSWRRESLRQFFLLFIVLLVTCLSWYIPMAMLSGGLRQYHLAIMAQARAVVRSPAPFLSQFQDRTRIFLSFLLFSLSLGVVPFLYYLGRFFRLPLFVKETRLQFLILWCLPALLFFFFVSIWNPGHILVIISPLFIYLAESLKGLVKDLVSTMRKISMSRGNQKDQWVANSPSTKGILAGAVFIIILVNIWVFGFTRFRVSYPTIKENSRRFTEFVRLTKENFLPGKTIILTVWSNTQAGYYLPDYLVYCPLPLIFAEDTLPLKAQNFYVSFQRQTTPKTYWIPTDFKIRPISIPKGIETIVFWGEELTKFYQNSERPLQKIESMVEGASIYYLKVKQDEKIYYGYHSLKLGSLP